MDLLITNQTSSKTECIIFFTIFYLQIISGFFSQHIKVFNKEVTSDKTSGDGWSYDPSTTTLTLENYTFNSATAPKHSFSYNGENFVFL